MWYICISVKDYVMICPIYRYYIPIEIGLFISFVYYTIDLQVSFYYREGNLRKGGGVEIVIYFSIKILYE